MNFDGYSGYDHLGNPDQEEQFGAPRKIGEWSQEHPHPKVEKVPAKPKERPPARFAVDSNGVARVVSPDHINRAARRALPRREMVRRLKALAEAAA